MWSPDGSRIFFLSRVGHLQCARRRRASPARGFGHRRQPDHLRRSGARRQAAGLCPWRFALHSRRQRSQSRGIATMSGPALCAWSPAGTFVACATGNPLYAAPGASFGNLSPGRIVVCDVASGRLSTVTDSLSLNTSPAWSPDGKWLYFVSSRDGRRDIYMEAIGRSGNAIGAPVRLSVGLGAHTISVSGTGTQLAYSLYTARTSAWSIPVPDRPGDDVDRGDADHQRQRIHRAAGPIARREVAVLRLRPHRQRRHLPDSDRRAEKRNG